MSEAPDMTQKFHPNPTGPFGFGGVGLTPWRSSYAAALPAGPRDQPKALASLMAKGGEVAQLLHGMPAVRETQDGSICGCSEKMGEKTTMIEQGDDVVVQCEMS